MGGPIADLGRKFVPTEIEGHDSPSVDSFGRWRTAEPQTIFDSKQLSDNQPLFWDDAEVSGGGTSSTYSSAKASSVLKVSSGVAGNRTRQTFQRLNYQPGKSQQIMMTGILNKSGGGAGIVQRLGYFDDNNGIFFENNQGTINIVQRSKTSGSIIDTTVAQSAWNLNKMDGSNGVTMDFTKVQIFLFDFEWLGTGRVRVGMVHGGNMMYSHQFLNDNTMDVVYMSTPNLPVRYSIVNDSNGGDAEIEQICATVISEGGREDIGILRYKSTEGVHVDANTENTVYALVGIRLKSTYLGTTINLESFSVLAETNDDFEWLVIFNPTVADTFTYGNESNSAIQTAIGVTANTVTGGTVMDGGFANSTIQGGGVTKSLKNALRLGAKIDGTVDEIVLCVRPLSINADIQGSLSWRELS